MTQDESFVLCAAFRYAQGRQTFAMEVVVNHICKQFDRMSTEEDHVNRLEKELRGCLK